MLFKTLQTLLCLSLAATAYAAPSPVDATLFQRTVDHIELVGLTLPEKLLWEQVTLFSKAGARTSQALLQQDELALLESGWFESVRGRVEPVRYGIKLVFEVEENPVIKALILPKSQIFSHEELRRLIPQPENTVLNLKQVQAGIQSINQAYADRGYTLCQVSWLRLDRQNQTLNLQLREPVVEQVNIVGNQRVQASVVLREMQFKPGMVYNEPLLRKDRNRILRLGYFSAISPPQLHESSQSDRLKITFEVTEQKTNLLGFGVEQDENDLVFFGNMTLANLLGSGESFSLKGQVGQIQSFRFRYYNPWILRNLHVGFKFTRFSDINSDTLLSQTIKVLRDGWESGLDFPLSDEMQFSALYASVRSSETQTQVGLLPYQSNSIKLVARYDDTRVENNLDQGSVWWLQGEQGGNLGLWQLGGLDFLRAEGRWTLFLGLTDDSILGINLNAGWYRPTGTQVLETETFEVGGGSSLRGIVDTSPLKGTRKMLANIELRHPLGERFQAVIFFDTGKAFEGTYSLDQLQSGVGCGLRLMTPVGPLRLDSAWGRDGHVLHFGLGSVF